MNQNYSDLIEQISALLFKTIVEQEPNLAEKVNQLDRNLLSLLRAIGLRVMSWSMAKEAMNNKMVNTHNCLFPDLSSNI